MIIGGAREPKEERIKVFPDILACVACTFHDNSLFTSLK